MATDSTDAAVAILQSTFGAVVLDDDEAAVEASLAHIAVWNRIAVMYDTAD